MLSIIPTLDTTQTPVNVMYRSLESIGIITERQVDSCRKYFKGNYNMMAHSLVIMYRIESSRRNYIASGRMDKARIIRDDLTTNPFFKDQEELDTITRFLTRLIETSKKMNIHSGLTPSVRSHWKFWSIWGEKDESEVLLKDNIMHRKQLRLSILNDDQFSGTSDVYQKIYNRSKKRKVTDSEQRYILNNVQSSNVNKFNSTSRIMTMIVTQATKDEGARIPTSIWNSLKVSDPISYLKCNTEMIPKCLRKEIAEICATSNERKRKNKNKSKGNKAGLNLKNTDPAHSTFKEYYNFYYEVHRFCGSMEVTHALSTIMAIISMSFLWDNNTPSTEDQYMALWQVGWKKYAVASDKAIGMDSHLIKVLRLWEMYNDKQWKEQ